MTKLTVIKADEKLAKKEIEFLRHFDILKQNFVETTGKPSDWDNVISLPFKIYSLDVFVCYGFDNDPKNGNIFLGKLNDGIILPF